ncbi:MAG: hypothetical protein NTY71_07355 [Methanoregula sp.]|jgi:DNA/RNA endonuclease YhcR with UshA esterase domain|nr:hypothetical protein [Methanoregula sp.]
MFGRQERIAFLLLIAVALVVIASHLVLDTLGKRPFTSPFTNNSADGELVYFSGTINRLSLTKSGGHLIIDVNNISIFISNQIAADLTLRKGENVTIIGIVQTYRGNKEIIVQSTSDILTVP